MRWPTQLRMALRSLFGKQRMEHELDEELRYHLERQTAENIKAGMSPEEARRAARLELGGVEQVKEKVRGSRLGAAYETLWQDLRYGTRMLRRNPGFTVVAVFTLALGIGANTAIFSVVHAVVLRPLPYPEPDRLVTLWSQEDWRYGTNGPEYFDFRQRQKTLEDIAIYTTIGGNLTGEGDPVRATAAAVTAGFFPILGVEPLLGRTFTEEEDTPGKNDVIVLEHGFWQRQLGGDPGVLGRTLFLNGGGYTVIGVMPPGFAFPDNTVDIWVPAGLAPSRAGGRTGHGLESVARIRPGVSLEQASQDIRRISLQFHEEHPEAYPEQFRSGWTLRLNSLQASMVSHIRPALLILLGAVGLVLLITCANVANLLLARATSREKEIAIRASLGAGRGRLVRQLLTESTLLSLLGGLLGLGLAVWGVEALIALAPPNIPRLKEIDISTQVLVFTLGVSLLTGILFGLAPSFHAARGDLRDSLKEGGRGTDSPGRQRLRSVLVVAEIALSLIMLIGAGLMMTSFSNLLKVDPGFRTENVLTFQLTLPRRNYRSPESRVLFYEQLLQQIKSLPGVEAAGSISTVPLGGEASSALMAEGMPPNFQPFPHGLIVLTGWRVVTPGLFPSLGITLLQGRLFADMDAGDAPLVAIVSDEFAHTAWPDEKNFVGKRVAFPSKGQPEWRTVVGVVRDIREFKLASQRYKDAYFPLAQVPTRSMSLTVRTAGKPESLVPAIRRELASVDPALPPYDIRTMEERFSQSVAQPRFVALLMALFALQALILGAVGIYGVVAYSASQRTHEIGIRMALGAQTGDILRMVLGHGLLLTVAGLGIGLAGALVLTRLLSSLLFGVGATDPATFAGVAVLLTTVALLASYLPARRATRVDPIVALRYE